MTRVAVLHNAVEPWAGYWAELRAAAVALKMIVTPYTIGRAADLGAVVVLPDAITMSARERIAELAMKQRLPTAFDVRFFVVAGGLMSYGPSLPQLSRRAADYVGRILTGTRPGDLPVEQPTTFELVINRKTARAIGLAIPASLLMRADQVID